MNGCAIIIMQWIEQNILMRTAVILLILKMIDFLKSAWGTVATGGANKSEPGRVTGERNDGAQARRRKGDSF